MSFTIRAQFTGKNMAIRRARFVFSKQEHENHSRSHSQLSKRFEWQATLFSRPSPSLIINLPTRISLGAKEFAVSREFRKKNQLNPRGARGEFRLPLPPSCFDGAYAELLTGRLACLSSSRMLLSQCKPLIDIRSVRLALVTSVMCSLPPVSFHTRYESIVPKIASPLKWKIESRATGRGRGSNRCWGRYSAVSKPTSLLSCRSGVETTKKTKRSRHQSEIAQAILTRLESSPDAKLSKQLTSQNKQHFTASTCSPAK